MQGLHAERDEVLAMNTGTGMQECTSHSEQAGALSEAAQPSATLDDQCCLASQCQCASANSPGAITASSAAGVQSVL